MFRLCRLFDCALYFTIPVTFLVVLHYNTAGENKVFPPDVEHGPDDLEDGRLPTALEPTHYVLEIQPDIYGEEPSFTNAGHVDIFFTAKETTNQIVLNSVHITIMDGSLELDNMAGTEGAPAITSWGMVPASEFFVVNLSDELIVGGQYVFRVSFLGQVVPVGERFGLYWDSYQEDGQTK